MIPDASVSLPSTPEERGRYIVEAIDRERQRIHRATGTTVDHYCRLTWDQYRDWYSAFDYRMATSSLPFLCRVAPGRSRAIEGVDVRPLLGFIQLRQVQS